MDLIGSPSFLSLIKVFGDMRPLYNGKGVYVIPLFFWEGC